MGGGMTDIGAFVPDNLIAGDFPVVTATRVVAENQTLTRGTLLGVVTADDEVITSDSAATDGSENVDSVLAQDVETGAGETKTVTVYETGEFRGSAMTFGGTDTAATRKKACRALSIFVKE